MHIYCTQPTTDLADNEKILSLHHAFLNHGVNTLSHLCFITVGKRSVDVPVTCSDGFFHRLCDFSWGRLTNTDDVK